MKLDFRNTGYRVKENSVRRVLGYKYYLWVLWVLVLYSLIFLATDWGTFEQIFRSILQIIVWTFLLIIVPLLPSIFVPIYWQVQLNKDKLSIWNFNKDSFIGFFLIPFKRNYLKTEMKQFQNAIKLNKKGKKYFLFQLELIGGDKIEIFSFNYPVEASKYIQLKNIGLEISKFYNKKYIENNNNSTQQKI